MCPFFFSLKEEKGERREARRGKKEKNRRVSPIAVRYILTSCRRGEGKEGKKKEDSKQGRGRAITFERKPPISSWLESREKKRKKKRRKGTVGKKKEKGKKREEIEDQETATLLNFLHEDG